MKPTTRPTTDRILCVLCYMKALALVGLFVSFLFYDDSFKGPEDEAGTVEATASLQACKGQQICG